MRLGVLCGLAWEARILARAQASSGARLDVACAAARHWTAFEQIEVLADRGIDTLVSFGLAGALDPNLRPGQLVAAGRVVLPGGESLPVDGDLNRVLARTAAAEGIALYAGDVVGAEDAVTKPDSKRVLAAETGCSIVDMESHVIAAECRRRGMPFMVLRAVADTAEMKVPEAAIRAIDAAGHIRIWPVLADLARRPASATRYFALTLAAQKGQASLRRGARLLCRLSLEAGKA